MGMSEKEERIKVCGYRREKKGRRREKQRGGGGEEIKIFHERCDIRENI